MCKVLHCSTSGYYQWCKEKESRRAKEDKHLIDLICVLHKESFGSYGVRRIVRGLRSQGILVNQKRIRRLMQEIGICGKGAPKKKKFITTTDSNHTNPVAPNHLNRQFQVSVPDTAWVTDITYLWTEEGWLYLAVVIDLFSRMVIGWATSASITAELVCLALQKAVIKRNIVPNAYEVLLHSDRGVQYTSEVFRQLCERFGITQSMSRKANCWDNAVAESFFRTFKIEAFKGDIFLTRKDAEDRVFMYIESFYNTRRAHSSLFYKSPIQFEADMKFVEIIS
jgi:transposase InsO family protein